MLVSVLMMVTAALGGGADRMRSRISSFMNFGMRATCVYTYIYVYMRVRDYPRPREIAKVLNNYGFEQCKISEFL